MNSSKRTIGRGLILSILILSSLTACGTTRMTRQYASVVHYLYTNKTDPVEIPTIPVLSLPLRVGIAFVPEEQITPYTPSFPEKEKLALLQEISAHFKQYSFACGEARDISLWRTLRGSIQCLCIPGLL